MAAEQYRVSNLSKTYLFELNASLNDICVFNFYDK